MENYKVVERSRTRGRVVELSTVVEGGEAGASDFAREWAEITENLRKEAAGALRIGQNLIRIRDALKPLRLWLKALREHGISQPHASRYIRFAEMPEADREPYLRLEGPFSLSHAVGERRGKKKGDHSPANGSEAGAMVPAEEMEEERRAEIALARKIVEEGARQLAFAPPPEHADDHERWQSKVREAGGVLRRLLDEHLRSRPVPGASR